MKHIKKFNETLDLKIFEDTQNSIKLNSVNDLKSIKSGKDIDNAIKQQLQFYLSYEFREYINGLISEIKKGTKSDDMPDKYKEIYKLIIADFKDKNLNIKGPDTIPQKIKKIWNEDISITKSLIIEYLEDLKGNSSPNFRKPFDWKIQI